MSLYRKKPVVIEALQWDGTYDSYDKLHARWPNLENASLTHRPHERTIQYWSIRTLEGQHIVSKGDYIIKGVKGEFYPCKPDIFEMTYEEEHDQTT
jgi:hypothetical protein